MGKKETGLRTLAVIDTQAVPASAVIRTAPMERGIALPIERQLLVD
jgi:hypothetical protein